MSDRKASALLSSRLIDANVSKILTSFADSLKTSEQFGHCTVSCLEVESNSYLQPQEHVMVAFNICFLPSKFCKKIIPQGGNKK
nr:MAG TPA: hypothetical protein [Caudoviricetes sp.]